MDGCLNTWMDGRMRACMDGWTHACMHGWVDACVHAWMGGQMGKCVNAASTGHKESFVALRIGTCEGQGTQ
jgi:hypothetical protein